MTAEGRETGPYVIEPLQDATTRAAHVLRLKRFRAVGIWPASFAQCPYRDLPHPTAAGNIEELRMGDGGQIGDPSNPLVTGHLKLRSLFDVKEAQMSFFSGYAASGVH